MEKFLLIGVLFVLLAGGTGGVIILDTSGHTSMPFNTPGMYRGSINVTGELSIGI